jgi:hypothetical protein
MLMKPTDLRQGLAAALLVLLAPVALAQEQAESDAEDAEPVAEEAPIEEQAIEGIEDAELDTQGFDPTADDDFIPSEDIPADAPIDFPTDI